MPDDERTTGGASGRDEPRQDEALARELRNLGPLILRQEAAEATEPDPTFAHDLRARLIDAPPALPDPDFARALRGRLVDGSGARAPRRRAIAWSGLAAAAMIAAVIVLLILRQAPSQRARQLIAGPPQPSVGDLTRGYPMPPSMGGGGGAGGGNIAPTQSVLGIGFGGGPYPGHIALSVGHLPYGASTLPAYRLRGPSFDLPRVATLARAVGIHAPVTRAFDGVSAWRVAADGGYMVRKPLHSLAVSALTGELIYHDTVYAMATTYQQAQPEARAVAEARSWLRMLGWPGQVMPLQGAQLIPDDARTWQISFGWSGVGSTDVPAAIVAVVAGGHVSDARLWPPAVSDGMVMARGASVAAAALRAGTVPLAVTMAGPLAAQPGDGRGRLDSVTVVQVLTADLGGRLFLVPAYRFSGTALLEPAGQKSAARPSSGMAARWYALVPAGRP